MRATGRPFLYFVSMKISENAKGGKDLSRLVMEILIESPALLLIRLDGLGPSKMRYGRQVLIKMSIQLVILGMLLL